MIKLTSSPADFWLGLLAIISFIILSPLLFLVWLYRWVQRIGYRVRMKMDLQNTQQTLETLRNKAENENARNHIN